MEKWFIGDTWAMRFFVLAIVVVAYFIADFFFKRRKKDTTTPTAISILTHLSWELEQMTVPHAQHGLAQPLEKHMSALLTLRKNETFSVRCPLNTFTGKWEVADNGTDTSGLQSYRMTFADLETTACEGNETVLRSERHFVAVLKNTRTMRLAHAHTSLLLFDAEGLLIGMLHEKPEERAVFFKK